MNKPKIIVLVIIILLILFNIFWFCCRTFCPIPRIEQYVADQLYYIVEHMDIILNKNNVLYWADGGTLLGSIRNGGHIPWDDDADITIKEQDEQKFLDLKPQFEQVGLTIYKEGDGLHKISFYGTKRPFCDVFLVKDVNGIYKPVSNMIAKVFPKMEIPVDNILPVKRSKFGPFYINIPREYLKYMQHYFGDWTECLCDGLRHSSTSIFQKLANRPPRRVKEGQRVILPSNGYKERFNKNL